MSKHVELMVREGCGSCVRVAEQIRPLVRECGAQFSLVDVDTDPELAAEYGDRVPVVVIDDEEFACWEVDSDDLVAELKS